AYHGCQHPFAGTPSQLPTPKTIFRGVGNGVLVGPYISQFLYVDIAWGGQTLEQKLPRVKEMDYLTTYDPDWLDAQNGMLKNEADDLIDPDRKKNLRYITTPRDLAHYVHHDALYQAYLGACLIMQDHKCHLDDLLPYVKDKDSETQ